MKRQSRIIRCFFKNREIWLVPLAFKINQPIFESYIILFFTTGRNDQYRRVISPKTKILTKENMSLNSKRFRSCFEFSNLCFFVHSTIAPRSNKNSSRIHPIAHYSKKFQSYFDHDESYYSPCIKQKILPMTRLRATRHPKPSDLNHFITKATTYLD